MATITLEEIIEEFGPAEKIYMLSLSGRQLTEFPKGLGKLSNLRVLSLAENELAEIPSYIEELTQIHTLILYRNQLSVISPKIGQLTNLKELSLEGTDLVLPAEIARLKNLNVLYLVGMGLKDIPDEIKSLKELIFLDLSDNCFTTLPHSIGGFPFLRKLVLNNNQITELPYELGRLEHLNELELDGSIIHTPSPEILQQGIGAILRYLRDLGEDTAIRQYVSKLLVVGQGGVGKTQLLAALRGEDFDEQSDTTHGLNVGDLTFAHPSKPEETMTLKAWDFAGQDIEHATHQFFFSNRSLFVLVWNARHGYEQNKIYYWLDTIRAKAPNSPVLLVATHVEDGRDADLPLADLKKKYPQIVDNFSVSNYEHTGFDELREALCRQAAALPLMGELWPSKWLAAANAVRALDDKHCSPEKIFDLMAEHNVDEELSEMLLRWLHDLGELLHFADNPKLCDLVVLKPQWVREYISRVLEDDTVRQNGGTFTKADMKRLWRDLDVGVREHLLEMMEQFDLSYRTLEDDEISLVVERLPHENLGYAPLWEAKSNEKEVSLIYQLSSIPAGIPTWSIARLHRFSTHQHWRTGALFQQEKGDDPSHLALLKADNQKRSVELSVRGPQPQNFLALLRDGFEQTLSRFPGLEKKRQIPCPCQGRKSPCSYLFDYDRLLKWPKPRIECQETANDIEVARLLFGLDWNRKDEVLKRLDALIKNQNKAKRVNQEQLNLIRNLTELTQREFLRAFRRSQSFDESYCPNVFTLHPIETSNWRQSLIGQKSELCLCCQAPGQWHQTIDGGRYEITDTAEWLQEAAPYLQKLVGVMKYALPLVSSGLGVVSKELATDFKFNLDFTKQLATMLPEITTDTSMIHGQIGLWDDEMFHFSGFELRWLRSFLDEKDKTQNWGGLKKVLTPEGDYLWLCEEHHKDYS